MSNFEHEYLKLDVSVLVPGAKIHWQGRVLMTAFFLAFGPAWEKIKAL
jgi:hypothetical protein